MFKKILFVFILIIGVNSMAYSSYEVTGQLEGPKIKADYRMMGASITYADNGHAYIQVITQGDCRMEHRFRCDSRYDHHRGWNDCYSGIRQTCNEQTGLYKLPVDAVVFDGDKRLKYVGDGQWLTIARKDRFPFFPLVRYWNLRHKYVDVEVSDNYQSAKLIISR
jgi:hypothetical protein